MMNPFADPNLMVKLEAHPKTREFLKQPDYKLMIQLMQFFALRDDGDEIVTLQ